MNLTRRGLFGLLGRAAAAAGLARVVAALPAAPAVAASAMPAAPFAASFLTDPFQCMTSSSIYGTPTWFPRGSGTMFERDVVRISSGRLPWKPETLAERVRRRVSESRRIRYSHPAARQFWGLP